MNKQKSFIAQELGRLGGEKTKEKYGNDHFKELSQKAVKARRKKKENLLVDKSL